MPFYIVLQLNNNILRDVLKDNELAMGILESDNKTQELLNYQIADILVTHILF